MQIDRVERAAPAQRHRGDDALSAASGADVEHRRAGADLGHERDALGGLFLNSSEALAVHRGARRVAAARHPHRERRDLPRAHRRVRELDAQSLDHLVARGLVRVYAEHHRVVAAERRAQEALGARFAEHPGDATAHLGGTERSARVTRASSGSAGSGLSAAIFRSTALAKPASLGVRERFTASTAAPTAACTGTLASARIW